MFLPTRGRWLRTSRSFHPTSSVWRRSTDETQVHIAKHVLKTLCTDVTNILLNFLAADLMMSVENPAAISSEVRLRPPPGWENGSHRGY